MWSKFGATKSKLGGYREAQKDRDQEMGVEHKPQLWDDKND